MAPPPATVSSSLKNLVTSAIGAAAGEDTPKPSSTSPAAGESSSLLYAFYVRQGVESAVIQALATSFCALSMSCHLIV